MFDHSNKVEIVYSSVTPRSQIYNTIFHWLNPIGMLSFPSTWLEPGRIISRLSSIRKDWIDVRSDQAFNYGCHSTETFHWVHLIESEWAEVTSVLMAVALRCGTRFFLHFRTFILWLAFGEAKEHETFRKWMTATWFRSISITVYFWLRQKGERRESIGRAIMNGVYFMGLDLLAGIWLIRRMPVGESRSFTPNCTGSISRWMWPVL